VNCIHIYCISAICGPLRKFAVDSVAVVEIFDFCRTDLFILLSRALSQCTLVTVLLYCLKFRLMPIDNNEADA